MSFNSPSLQELEAENDQVAKLLEEILEIAKRVDWSSPEIRESFSTLVAPATVIQSSPELPKSPKSNSPDHSNSDEDSAFLGYPPG